MTLVKLHPLPIALLNLPAAAFQGQTGASLACPSINAPVTLTVLLCGGRSVPGPCPPPLDLLPQRPILHTSPCPHQGAHPEHMWGPEPLKQSPVNKVTALQT